MDKTTSLICFGCNLAKTLEAMLPNLANKPDILSRKCDEIVTIFSNVKKRLSQQQHMNGLMQEWSIANSYSYEHILGERKSALDMRGLLESTKMKAIELQEELRLDTMMVGENGGEDLEALKRPWGDGGQLQEMNASDSSWDLSSQRQKTRRDGDDKLTVRVGAPRMGNTEIPPEDGHTWRKYGQKDILGSKFPRAYYRCTHQKLYKCPAKKQVQRLDNDPYMFEVTYRGQHACLVSFTTPSTPPPPPSTKVSQEIAKQDTQMPPSQPFISFPSSYWISMDVKSLEEGMQQMHRDLANITDIMFSSSSSSGNNSTELVSSRTSDKIGAIQNNSMELIFSSMLEHGDAIDKQYY